jgi:chemotaxis regulatin CheY-phosphate phosphatase CheZ
VELLYGTFYQVDGAVGLDSASMSEMNIIFRKSGLNQLKVIIPQNVRQLRPTVSHWRLDKESKKIQRVNLDKKDVTKKVVSLDQAAADEILNYISSCT